MSPFPSQTSLAVETKTTEPPDLSAGGPSQMANKIIAWTARAAIAVHLILHFSSKSDWLVNLPWMQLPLDHLPLILALVVGAPPLLWRLGKKVLRLQFGSDLLAGISIVTAIILGQYL